MKHLGTLLILGATITSVLLAITLEPGNPGRQTVADDTAVAAPVRATTASRAVAAVNETYSWGLEIEGLPLREAPFVSAPDAGGRVLHGDQFEIICLATGQRVTNGNDENPTDDANTFTSSLWWKVIGPEGEGFISNVWFARTVNDDLGAPPC